MAGNNKILKEGTVLFRAGEASDGMYVIRKGELRVYLEQDGKEVALATVPAGGMIGEMALFDRQPRSASVKAVSACEVTHISTDDFSRLMKQIPKWFVGLMSALSGRLRDTNARLQRLEQGGKAGSKPYDAVLRCLNILMLLWHRDGAKEGKEWTIQKEPVIKTLTEVFGEDPEKVKALFEVMVKEQFLSTKKDTYNNVVFATPQKGQLGQLTAFIQEYLKQNQGKATCLSDGALTMTKLLAALAEASPYDSLTASVDDIAAEGQKQEIVDVDWAACLDEFKAAGEAVKITKTSNGAGLKTTKKDVGSFLKYHSCLAALHKSNLS